VFQGYVRFSNIDLINAEATEAYVAHQAPGLGFRPTVKSHTIHVAVEDDPYESPAVDEAPWFNANDPNTADFYGLYPLEITGVGDSTLTVPVTEAVGDGGSMGEARDATRSIRVHGVLVGSSEVATETGLSWLRNSLKVEACSQIDGCGAGDFTYFLADPDVCPVAFSGTEIGSVREQYGSLTSGVASRRWTTEEVLPAMPSRVRWTGTPSQGTVIVYGAKSRYGDTILEQSDPFTATRINYATNPSFRTSTTNWTGLSGGAPQWILQGGADGLGYCHLDTTAWQALVISSGGSVFGSDTFGTGLFGGGGSLYGDGVYGEGVYGGTTSGPGVGTPGVSTIASVPAGHFVASMSLRGAGLGNPVTIQAVDPVTLAVLATTNVNPAADAWEQFSITGVASTHGVSLQVMCVDGLDIDQVMVEVGTLSLGYFDGSTVGGPEVYQWLGAPDASASTAGWSGYVETVRDDSNYRPFIEVLQGSISNLTIEWFMREPIDVETQLLPYQRTYHDVRCTQGVQVINRFSVEGGGYFIEVDFILVAGNPHAYSIPRSVPTVATVSGQYTDVAPAIVLDDEWLYDPDCIIPTPPPIAPAIAPDCIDDVSQWQRYYVPIPAEDVSSWASSVPTIGINSHANPISQVRVRFYPNPFNYPATSVDPTNYCAEFIVSYLPAQTRLGLNGTTRRSAAYRSGKAVVSADHLLYGTGGGPMTWPELTCGVPYVMTLDIPENGNIDAFDIDLQIALKE
jgi:hypothetical protein